MRAWIETLEPGGRRPMASGSDLAAALDKLCLGDEIYRLVQEGLNNIGRHSGSLTADVNVEIGADSVSIVIADRGKGFPFLVRQRNLWADFSLPQMID